MGSEAVAAAAAGRHWSHAVDTVAQPPETAQMAEAALAAAAGFQATLHRPLRCHQRQKPLLLNPASTAAG